MTDGLHTLLLAIGLEAYARENELSRSEALSWAIGDGLTLCAGLMRLERKWAPNVRSRRR